MHSRVGRPRVKPELKKIPVGYKLPRWLVEWLRGQDVPSSILIEEALVKKHGLRKPE